MKKDKVIKVIKGMIKFGKEKKVTCYQFPIEMDDTSEEALYNYALNGIRNDRGAMINWAINDILKKKIEKG